MIILVSTTSACGRPICAEGGPVIARITITDIAREAGLSKGAVSYALNGQPGVSEATRRRVREIADRLGWHASQAARSLSSSRAEAIGLVLGRPPRLLALEPFYMEFISGIESVISRRGTALLLHVAEEADGECETYRRWWAQRRVDGVIVVDLTAGDERVPLIGNLQIPAVYVGVPTSRPDEPQGVGRNVCVRTDDDVAMRDAILYLARLGHRRIARVAGVPWYLHVAARDEAFVTTAAECGLGDVRIVQTDYSGEAGARATRQLLSAPEPPTAIVFDNDIMAVASLGVASELGFDVPGDLSLLAWDDSPLCEITHPALSAMHRDVAALGALAATSLLQHITDGPEEVSAVAATTLIVRGSTGRARI